LLHAIGHAVAAQGSEVVYVSSETFTNELIESIRQHRTDDFRLKFRNAPVLLIDDVQFIAGKERTEEEFFHTFNAIHEAGGQIVLSSDRPPRAMPILEDRLRSRFEWRSEERRVGKGCRSGWAPDQCRREGCQR